jgi:hypothetical protein
MRDIVTRATRARPELAAELLRRGIFTPEERAEFLRSAPRPTLKPPGLPLGPVQFATLLAQGDTQLAARVVLRDLIRPNELAWLDRLLRFRKPNDKRDELARIVERALEGRKGNARKYR